MYRDQLPPGDITEITQAAWERLHDQARVAVYLPLLVWADAAEGRIRQAIVGR
jgi:hypothetical protein